MTALFTAPPSMEAVGELIQAFWNRRLQAPTVVQRAVRITTNAARAGELATG